MPYICVMQKRAILIGANGLIGSNILEFLIQYDYEEIQLLLRKEISISNTKITQRLVDFDGPETWEDAFEDCSHVFCAIGTTRKKTPNLNDYRKVD